MILYKTISLTECSCPVSLTVRELLPIIHPMELIDPPLLSGALIELCKDTDIQNKLRTELVQFGNTDPTWEQLNSSLPYLDAVVHETLRMHPPVFESVRVVGVCSSAY